MSYNIKKVVLFLKKCIFKINVICEWNKLAINIVISSSLLSFEDTIFKAVRQLPDSIYGIRNPLELALLSRLSMSFSHLPEHKFKQNFQDIIDLFCSCLLNINTIRLTFSCIVITLCTSVKLS